MFAPYYTIMISFGQASSNHRLPGDNSLLLTSPAQRSFDCTLPSVIQLLPLLIRHRWFECSVYLPLLNELVCIFPKTNTKPAIYAAPKLPYLSLQVFAQVHQNVCLELHQEIVANGSAIYSQRSRLCRSATIASKTSFVWCDG